VTAAVLLWCLGGLALALIWWLTAPIRNHDVELGPGDQPIDLTAWRRATVSELQPPERPDTRSGP